MQSYMNKIMVKFLILSAMALISPLMNPSAARSADLPVDRLQLPPGFSISVYAKGLEGARSMTLGPKGIVFVGTRETGKIYAITDFDHDNKGDDVITFAQGLFQPNGVEFHDGSLYVGEINRVIRYDDVENKLNNPPKPVVVNGTLPDKLHHGWKYIRFGPDGLLYVPIGAPCNCCLPTDERFASLCRMKADGSNFEIFAKGIRNTVGFDWQPETKELWFTDNGRDMLGDNIPPEELNCAPHKGMHFGFPYCHAGEIPDPEFGKKRPCSEFEPPRMKLPAHVAPLAVHFYTGNMFPAEYKNSAFICEHGSWNRTVPDGYRISLVRFENNKPVKYEPFITGWLQPKNKGGVWGRPVDTLIMPDGSMLISDDYAGAIYRLSYSAADAKQR